MKIIIISDLHIGDAAVSKEFAVESSPNSVKNRLLEEFKELVQLQKLNADYLVVAGDITNRATKEEFELAAQRLLEISSIIGVDRSKIFFVPGNHDSNWDEEKLSMDSDENIDIVIERKYKDIRHNNFFKQCIERADSGDFYTEPYFTCWSDDHINVIGLNSSVFDHYNRKPHHGIVRKQDLKKLDAKLEELKVSSGEKLNILIVHHHPIQQPDLPFSEADHSILQNAGVLMDIASKHNINFIIHGHKHIPRLTQFANEYSHPINILCAGSFSARLDDRWFQGVPNTFHQIEVDRVCTVNNTPMGKVVSWSHNTGHGWTKHESINGIPHLEFFGNRTPAQELKSQIEAVIKELFKTQSHVKWSDLSSQFLDIAYTSRKLLQKILRELSTDLGFSIHETPGQDELFILLKV